MLFLQSLKGEKKESKSQSLLVLAQHGVGGKKPGSSGELELASQQGNKNSCWRRPGASFGFAALLIGVISLVPWLGRDKGRAEEVLSS